MTDSQSEYVNRDGLFVAGRGDGPDDGLHYFVQRDGGWEGIHLARVEQLAALAWHPSLPIVYGLSGFGRGTLLAWDVSGAAEGVATELARVDSGGEIPCDVAVDPTGRVLLVANFGFDDVGGTLASWRLDGDGVPLGDPRVIDLGEGSGVVSGNQDRAHPHQLVFHQGRLHVPDYGADRVRSYDVDLSTAELVEGAPAIAPPGSAPRHMCFVGSGPRFVASAELGGVILASEAQGSDDARWASTPATARTGAVPGRHPRNYPGDIKLAGHTAYFANRGYDTIAMFDVASHEPRPMGEVDSGTRWAQHMLVDGDVLLVAGWDSGTVASLPLDASLPGETLFDCAGAGWILRGR